MGKSWIPTVAGVLDLVAGGLALVGFAVLSLGLFVLTVAPDIDPDEFGIVVAKTVLVGLSFATLLIGLLALIGGVCALQRRRWGWALAGSIAAAFACPPLGVAAIILTVLAEKDLAKSD